MSIEKLIEENTAALRELISVVNDNKENQAAFLKAWSQLDGAFEAKATNVKADDKKADTKKSTAETASSAKGAGQAASEKSDNAKDKPAASKEETEALYETIKQPFLDLAGSDRPAAVALLAEVGVKQLKLADHAQLLKAKKLLGIKDEEELS